MSNPSWAMCTLENCNKKATCERFDSDSKMLYNMSAICLKNDFKLYIEGRVELEGKDE